MSTISKTETPTDGQEETAILLEEQARRIATLQEPLKQAGRIRPNEAVILQEIKRVVEERNDLKRRLERAEAVKDSLTTALRDIKKNVDDWDLKDYVTIRRLVNTALRTAEDSSVVGLIDSMPAKQQEDSAEADGDGDSVIDEEVNK